MTCPPWTVKFFAREDEHGKVRQVLLDEIRDELTVKQFAVVLRQIKRLEEHGRQHYRLLFAQENKTFKMLVAYKEKRNSIPASKIRTAAKRATSWRS